MRTVTRRPYTAPPWQRQPGRPSPLSRNTKQMTYKRPGPAPKGGHGTIDYARRFYQFSSGKGGISGCTFMGGLSFGFDDEWKNVILRYADWIEFQDRTTTPWTFYRISVAKAKRVGRKVATKTGDRWIVPLHHFAVSRRRVL